MLLSATAPNEHRPDCACLFWRKSFKVAFQNNVSKLITSLIPFRNKSCRQAHAKNYIYSETFSSAPLFVRFQYPCAI